MTPSTTRARLRLYRERAAKSKYNQDWRAHRYENPWNPAWHSWRDDNRKIYADDKDTLGNYLGDWNEFATYRDMRDNLGFYCDSWCSDTIKGGVELIRTAKGALYVPVTYCTGWDGVTYYMGGAERVNKGATEEEHETAKKEAADSAYYYAEREAEQAREDDAKQRAENDIAERLDELRCIRKDARALLAEIRGREFTENVCAALRHRLREYLDERRECFRVIAERRENYWSAVPY